MRIAVLSDIHPTYTDSSRVGDSHLRMDGSILKTEHPFTALYDLIGQENLKADYVICAGDLGSRSDPATISYSWAELHNLKTEISANKVIATPGNHDHDSRSHFSQYDPKSILQQLSPPFPYDFKDDNSHYWAWNFDLIEEDGLRIVNINSSAHHGIRDEFLHGRIGEATINRLTSKISKLGEKPINIILCHHHIHKNEDIDIGDYDAMYGADRLLKCLEESSDQDWMIIHGHKHYPKLYYGPTTAGNPPIVFSAGSFSGDINGSIGTRARNQFYILDFDLIDLQKFGLVGTFRSWDWATGLGWIPANEGSGLPHNGGFGIIEKTKDLSDEMGRVFTDYITNEDEINLKMPSLKYLTPLALEKLKNHVKEKQLFDVHLDKGLVIQIAKIGS